jgi:hypothetical protein
MWCEYETQLSMYEEKNGSHILGQKYVCWDATEIFNVFFITFAIVYSMND